jgi:hypothetical protein
MLHEIFGGPTTAGCFFFLIFCTDAVREILGDEDVSIVPHRVVGDVGGTSADRMTDVAVVDSSES